jgi:hypothetical protein
MDTTLKHIAAWNIPIYSNYWIFDMHRPCSPAPDSSLLYPTILGPNALPHPAQTPAACSTLCARLKLARPFRAVDKIIALILPCREQRTPRPSSTAASCACRSLRRLGIEQKLECRFRHPHGAPLYTIRRFSWCYFKWTGMWLVLSAV